MLRYIAPLVAIVLLAAMVVGCGWNPSFPPDVRLTFDNRTDEVLCFYTSPQYAAGAGCLSDIEPRDETNWAPDCDNLADRPITVLITVKQDGRQIYERTETCADWHDTDRTFVIEQEDGEFIVTDSLPAPGTVDLNSPNPVDCGLSEDECIELINEASRAQRTPELPPDPRMREIVFANENVRSIIGSGVEGEDYWVNIAQFFSLGPNGGGMVTIAFTMPVSFSGEILRGSNPCNGLGDEGYVDPDHPCRDVPREYSYVSREFAGVRMIHMEIDLQRGQAVNLSPHYASASTVDATIEYFKTVAYGDPTPQSP